MPSTSDPASPSSTPPGGLSSVEAARLLSEHGPNALDEKRQSVWVKLFSYVWGPIPWLKLKRAVLRFWDRHSFRPVVL